MSVDNDSAHDAEPVCGNLVVRARDGDERAWAALVERYAPLIWSLCRRYRLDATDTADVGQNVWLLLVNQLGKIRDPAALPGWLATTTRRECARVRNKAQARLTIFNCEGYRRGVRSRPGLARKPSRRPGRYCICRSRVLTSAVS